MTRKNFVAALAAAGAAPAASRAADENPAPEAANAERFKQQWVASLLTTIDSQLDPAARVKFMESCGRACAQRGAVDAFKKASGGNLDKLLQALEAHLGAGNARREGNTVHLRYAKCYCPLVSAGRERLSNTYCECSRGWALEVFQAVTGKPVTVDLLSSVKRGDADCRFTIRIAG